MATHSWFWSYAKSIGGWWWAAILAIATLGGGVPGLLYLAKETGVNPLLAFLLAFLVASVLLDVRQTFVWRDENAAKRDAEARESTSRDRAEKAEERAKEAERVAQVAAQKVEAIRAQAEAFYADDAEDRGFIWEATYWDQPGQQGIRHYGRALVTPLRAIQPARLEAELSTEPESYWFELHACQAGDELRISPQTLLEMRGVEAEEPRPINLEGNALQILEQEIALTPNRRLVIQAVSVRPFEFLEIRRRKAPPADPSPTTPGS